VITHGENGFLAPNNRQHEWSRYLAALIQDKDLPTYGIGCGTCVTEQPARLLGTAWEEACLS
jgi:hypothetical protein